MENQKIIEKAIEYVHDHATEGNLSIEDVAKNAGFSIDYFNSIFLSHTGFNVMEYVRYERLKWAANRMRKTPHDKILDLALMCGYDSHESFSRAFKKQYGLTPSEFRHRAWNGLLMQGDLKNDQFAKRLLDEFPEFELMDLDEAIDELLSENPIRHAHVAVCMRADGGVVLTEKEHKQDGFLWLRDLGSTKIQAFFFSDNYDRLASWLNRFTPPRFYPYFYAEDTTSVLKKELSVRGVPLQNVIRHSQYVCRRKLSRNPLPHPKLSMRALTWDDRDLITGCLMNSFHFPYQQIQWINHSLKKRDVMGITDHPILVFGLFLGEKLIGIVRGNLLRTNGVIANTYLCIHFDERLFGTVFQGDDAFARFVKWSFVEATGHILDLGALCYDNLFDKRKLLSPTEVGYERAGDLCRIDSGEANWFG